CALQAMKVNGVRGAKLAGFLSSPISKGSRRSVAIVHFQSSAASGLSRTEPVVCEGKLLESHLRQLVMGRRPADQSGRRMCWFGPHSRHGGGGTGSHRRR